MRFFSTRPLSSSPSLFVLLPLFLSHFLSFGSINCKTCFTGKWSILDLDSEAVDASIPNQTVLIESEVSAYFLNCSSSEIMRLLLTPSVSDALFPSIRNSIFKAL